MKNGTPRKTINVDKPNRQTIYGFKELDNAVLRLSLYKNSIPFDVEGQTIRLGAKTSKGIIEQVDGFTINANELDIELKSSILVPGVVEIDLELKDANGIMTTASFFITVESRVLNDTAVQSTNEFDTFSKTVAKVEEDYNSLRKIIIDENQAANLQDQVNKTNAQLDNITTIVTPEMFEGSDTTKIQLAINYCIENNCKLVCNSKLSYDIDNTIYVSGILNADFNNVTLNVINNVDCVIHVESNHPNQETGDIKNLKIDCNNLAKIGIKHYKGKKGSYDGVQILNSIEKGMEIGNSNETVFNKIRVDNCPVGLEINSGDMHFIDIMLRFCHTGIRETKGINFFNRVHGWIKEDFEGSVFMEISGEYTSITDCYPDTYQIAYKINGWVKINISNGYCYYNRDYWDLEMLNKNAYFLYYDNAEHSSTTILNNTFINANGVNCYFSNFNGDELKIDTSKMGKMYGVFRKPNGIKESLTINEGWTVEKNSITKKDNRCILYLKIKTVEPITNNITKDVCTLTSNFLPENEIVTSCLYGGSYDVENISYMFLGTTGNLKIKPMNNIPENTVFHIYLTYDSVIKESY